MAFGLVISKDIISYTCMWLRWASKNSQVIFEMSSSVCISVCQMIKMRICCNGTAGRRAHPNLAGCFELHTASLHCGHTEGTDQAKKTLV